ncbi:GMPR2 isoform 31, partial [Pan troglodytes]
ASEGKTVEVPFKGDVEHTIRDILGGIRSTCTYVGAAKLKELSRRTTFIRVTQQVNPIFSEGSCSNSVLLYLHTQNAQGTHWGGSKEANSLRK